MQELNPYASPNTSSNPLDPKLPPAARRAVSFTPRMLDELAQTRPWVKFLSLLGFILSGLMLLVSMGLAATGDGNPAGGSFQVLIVFLAGLIYLILAALLYRFSSWIGELLEGGGDHAMEEALGAQRVFWCSAGQITAGILVLYAVFILVILGGAVLR